MELLPSRMREGRLGGMLLLRMLVFCVVHVEERKRNKKFLARKFDMLRYYCARLVGDGFGIKQR